VTSAEAPIHAPDLMAPASREAVESPVPLPPGMGAAIWRLQSRFMALLDRQPPVVLWLEMLLLVPAIGYADYITGYEVSVVLLYSLPILLMVRFADQQAAVFTALLCALTWWWADEKSGHHYTTAFHQTWETTVRLAYFLIFVLCGVSVKERIALLRRARQLEREIIRISEREQHRIGQDLHDGLCQYFAAVGCSAGSVKARLDRAGSPEAPAVQEIQDLILDGVQQTRALARGLFPVQNDEWGLPSALDELTASASHLQGIRCTFTSNASTAPIRNDCATHLFRIAQEALSNAIRHGAASEATLRLLFTDAALILAVEDNGTGFRAGDEDQRGLGLTIMHYRAREIGGRVTIRNNPEGGATVSCQVPLAAIRLAS